jgi:hypothetical protein
MDFRPVDEWWARALNVPVKRLVAGGIIVADHVDHLGALALRRHHAVCIYGPRVAINTLPQGLALESATAVIHGNSLARGLGGRAGPRLGPAWYGYATSETLRTPPRGAVRRLEERDRQAVVTFRHAVSPEDWTEAGMDEGPRYGCWVGDILVAGAGLGMWRGIPTVGVLTHPAYRRRGFGRAVVTAAAKEGLEVVSHVQYRSRSTNTASIALACAAGFVHYCDALLFEVSSSAAPDSSRSSS